LGNFIGGWLETVYYGIYYGTVTLEREPVL
jgi:hypothetical protein